MIIDQLSKTIFIKIIVYGPAMAGKTTLIDFIHSIHGDRGVLDKIEGTHGRTLFWDHGVYTFVISKGWKVKLILIGTTGQEYYKGNRMIVMNHGCDGIIFIADARKSETERNMASFAELVGIFGPNLSKIPIVICLNKYDLEKNTLISLEDFREVLKERFKDIIENDERLRISYRITIAVKGYGAIEALKQVLLFINPDLLKLLEPELNNGQFVII
ncbi:MAG: GTP-binding protein [Promethearchaeota archaeon]